MASPTYLDMFLEQLTVGGLESFRKYYSVYRASVVSNADPQKRGRAQVVVPQAGHRAPLDIWLDPVFQDAGAQRGAFFPPEKGDSVWVVFFAGDASQPICYFGSTYGTADVPSQFAYASDGTPKTRGWVTKANHSLVFKDEAGKEAIEIKWKGGSSFVTLDPKGDIEIQNQTGSLVTLQSNTITVKNAVGASAVLDSAKITVTDGAGNSMALDGVNTVTLKNNSGNSIELGAAGITITSAGPTMIQSAGPITLQGPLVNLGPAPSSPLVRYVDLLPYLLGHKHGCASGPTTPPLPIGPGAPPQIAKAASLPVIGS